MFLPRFLFLFVLIFYVVSATAQLGAGYAEAPNPVKTYAAHWAKLIPAVYASFANSNQRYKKEEIPVKSLVNDWYTKAWRGEKVHTQLVAWSVLPARQLAVSTSALVNEKGSKIAVQNIATSFVRYVLTDSLSSKGENCNIEPGADSSLVADVLDPVNVTTIQKNTTQPIWLTVNIPRDADTGLYKGTVIIKASGRSVAVLPFSIQVIERVLPAMDDYSFHLDLWQNPFSVSRVHQVSNWSDAHFKAMKPYFTMLRNAGQKVITASIIYDPWNSQTLDIYQSMIKWIKKVDGSWQYDYTIFDKWVSYMMSLGIDKQINCFSMIPWNLKFYYYDEALKKDTFIVAKPQEAAYKKHWEPMLRDFARHLRRKNWFTKTMIAMDEREMQDMQAAMKVIKNADKDWKVSLAGNYHAEIENSINDYCVASSYVLSDTLLAARKKKDFITTFYTACPESYPNVFTFSPPAETAFFGWYAAAKGFDGYLRWAYNCWPKNPLKDSRFGKWPGGDTYFVYPGGRSSIRFEKLVEGIQAFEKIHILKKLYIEKNFRKILSASIIYCGNSPLSI